jgi:ribosomal protein S28E/S33
VNESSDLAYFGSTVTRNHLTPVACKIQGRKNVGYTIQRCLSGTLRNNEEISSFISETEATKLESGSRLDNGMSRKEQIASKILRGEVSPADIKMGIEIDNLIYEIYQNQETVDPY